MQLSDIILEFFQIYTIATAFVLIFLIAQILYMMSTVDKDLLKAKLFLNETVMQRTWIYISIAGASFALNTFIKFATQLAGWGEILTAYHLYEITQLVFLVAFILAVYNWYVFIGSFASKD
ncbi:MAG: hypothetical protein ABOK23_13595 [Candidatus Methanoperedens sp.]|nr:hypothetical protein [Candidatus Methanoperedens sp.]